MSSIGLKSEVRQQFVNLDLKRFGQLDEKSNIA